MRTYLDCIPCFFDQALRAARMATTDETCIKQVLDEVGEMLKEIPLVSSPPMAARYIYEKISEITGNADPYKHNKREYTKKALDLYPHLLKQVQESKDPICAAVQIALIGNAIDFGPNHDVNLQSKIEDLPQQDFYLKDYSLFRSALDKTKDVLYIGDNAGETVYDRVLIEQLNMPVTFVVRGAPVINDATLSDAKQAGLDQVANILSSGTNAPGAVPDTCNHDFNQAFNRAGLVIAKGQGNYEALSDMSRPIVFMLKIKCDVIAKHIGVKKGAYVLRGANLNNDNPSDHYSPGSHSQHAG
jgi:uncharacterized protein with ATP-grasp and redox domains